jgi:putative transposase
MDASLQSRAERLAGEMATQARTAEDLNGLMRLMMKSALERMLNTEMDVHLGRRAMTVDTEEEPVETPPSEPSSPADAEKRPANRRNGRSRKTVQG